MNAHDKPLPLDPALDGLAVDVYRNLHSGGYSVRLVATGRVLAHAVAAILEDATFVVSARGRARCIAEGRKNVHAVVRGTLRAPPPSVPSAFVAMGSAGLDGWRPLTYNPRDGVPGFHLRASQRPLAGAGFVALSAEGAACTAPRAIPEGA